MHAQLRCQLALGEAKSAAKLQDQAVEGLAGTVGGRWHRRVTSLSIMRAMTATPISGTRTGMRQPMHRTVTSIPGYVTGQGHSQFTGVNGQVFSPNMD